MSNGVTGKPEAHQDRDVGTAGTPPPSASSRITRTLLQRLIRGVLVLAVTFVTIILSMAFGPATPWVNSFGPMLLPFFIAVFAFGALTPPIFPDRVCRPFRQVARGLAFAVVAMLPIAVPAALCYLFRPWLGLAMLGLGAVVMMPLAFWAGFIGEPWSLPWGDPKRSSRTAPNASLSATTSAIMPPTLASQSAAPAIVAVPEAFTTPSLAPSPAIALAAPGHPTSIAGDPVSAASAIAPVPATSIPAAPGQAAKSALPYTLASFSLLWAVKDEVIVRRPTGAYKVFRWLVTWVLASGGVGALGFGMWPVSLLLFFVAYMVSPGGGVPGAWVGRCPTCKGEVVFPDPTRSAILTPIKRLCPSCSAPIEIVRDRFIAIPDTGQRQG